MKLKVFIGLIIITLLAAGCGTIKADIQTTIHDSGEVTQEMNLAVTGAIASLVQDNIGRPEAQRELDEIRGSGWDITTMSRGDAWELMMSKNFPAAEVIDLDLLSIGDPGSNAAVRNGLPQVEIRSSGNIFVKDYDFSARIPATGPLTLPNLPSGTDAPMFVDRATQEQLMRFLRGAITLSWTVTTPGDITATNADRRQGNSATWDLNLGTFEQGRELTVKSRYVNWPLIIAITAAAAVVIIGIVVVTILSLRRRTITNSS